MPNPRVDPTSSSQCDTLQSDRPSDTADAEPRARSMHEDVEVWDGCGSCGAEPYWLEIGAELDGSADSEDEGAG